VVARHAPIPADLETFFFQSKFTRGIRSQFQTTGRAAHHQPLGARQENENASQIQTSNLKIDYLCTKLLI